MKYLLSLISALILFINSSYPQLSTQYIDSLAYATLKTFDVPGIAVGITKDGKTVHSQGYGLQSLNRDDKVNDHTLFGIASNSKGFTCIAISMLVDEGKLDWNDKVRKYIPEFTLGKPFMSEEFTILDLVTHRGGLGLGAGDLMFFPEGGNATVNDIIHNLRYLPIKSSFRSKFEYNNNFYIVAGEVIRRISGMTWEDFIEKRILKPVGMLESYPSYNHAKNIKNKIDGHAPTFANNSYKGIVKNTPHDWNPVANPAGGILSNIHDMMIWARFLLNNGVTKEGKRLISEKSMQKLWSIQTPIDINPKNQYNTTIKGYALGYFVSDVRGHREIAHTGGLIGTLTQFILIPDLQLGITILTNQQSGASFMTMSNTIKDSYLGYPDRNWLEYYDTKTTHYHQLMDSTRAAIYNTVSDAQKGNVALPNNNQLTGNYNDDWFGNISIFETHGQLQIACKNSPRLKGDLLPYNYTTYIAKWQDRSYDADVFVTFDFDEKGQAIGFNMKPIVPITDFSFNFQDLNLKRVK